MFDYDWFPAKNKHCDVYRIGGYLHVLIRQARTTGVFDRSNTASGFLVYDDPQPGLSLSIIQEFASLDEKFKNVFAEMPSLTGVRTSIYAPKIALLPAEGATNQGLISFLNSKDGISIEPVTPGHLGLSNAKKRMKGFSKDRMKSEVATAYARSDNILEAAHRLALQRIDDISPIRVYVEGDTSRLEQTLKFLQEVELVRTETLAALRVVIDEFVRQNCTSEKLKKHNLASELDRVIRPSLNQPV